ncbi:MAG: gamma-glutamyl-gamma-aminobutyrate hydrolase family protein [Clostridia bacterium]|nr:gamma-glutamyl-gamma-aminobutyrate hydrolase family protein [Clostridia bacterium]
MKPLIGLLVTIDDNKTTTVNYTYARAVTELGGTPIVLPYTADDNDIDRFVSLCDGFLFSGGKDVEPKRFGEEQLNDSLVVHHCRDELEFKLFDKIISTNKPILGICRGAQVINVALGGTLYQDIPSQIPSQISHRQKEGQTEYSHDILVVKDTPLHKLVGGRDRIEGNSFHHQAIKDLGDGLKLMATADDGVIEGAYYDGDRYLRIYQWHPEKLFDKHDHNNLIIKDFINACK